MTKSEIILKAAEYLEDVENIHFTDEDLSDSFDDGNELISITSQCVEKVGTLNLVAGQIYYNLRSTFPTYYKVFAVYNVNTSRWLDPVAFREIQSRSDTWELENGEPFEWAPLGQDYICIHRVPSDNSHSLIIYYTAIADALQDADTPDWPPDHHDALHEYMVSDLMDQDLEYSKSMNYWKRYQEHVEALKKYLRSRSTPDRIFSLSCRYSQQPTSRV